MGYGINGALNVGLDPYGYDASSLNRTRQYTGSYRNIFSVNEPIRISAHWNYLKENVEPSATNYDTATQDGDIVNVIFDVYQISDTSVGTFPDDWTLVGSIRKSRDIRNISQKDRTYGGDGVLTPQGHTFTVDISEMLRDLLSYSLVPHGKGTYTNTFFGGLNGGAEQQGNLMSPVWSDSYIVTKNGSYRKIKIRIRSEIVDNNGIIREATDTGSFKDSNSVFSIINSALDYDGYFPASRHGNAAAFIHLGWGTSSRYWRSFMTRCTNGMWSATGYNKKGRGKDVRMDEASEFLQWIQGTVNNYSIWNTPTGAGETSYASTNTSDLVDDVYMHIQAYDSSGVLLRSAKLYDWNQNLIPKTTINSVTDVWPRSHYRMCAQNVSPVYINANCIHMDSAVKDIWENGGETYTRHLIDVDGNASDKTALFLNDDIAYYSARIVGTTTTQGNGTGVVKTYSEYRWFNIDRDRFLNTNDANSGDRYAGIYYTELRSDQLTLPHPIRCKGFRWNCIKNQTDYFRIHWLNKCGGIDSYTIKGQKSISYNSEKDIIQRKEPNRLDWRIGRSSAANPYPTGTTVQSPSGSYQSDYMGDTMNHKGGLEVLNVSATKSGTVTTLPLAQDKADWLREILTSPNVWTENLTQQVESGSSLYNSVNYRSVTDYDKYGINTDGRTPNNMEYVPLIITSSSMDTYDESKGLVTMTFEYTHSHAVVTQRN